ncbi:uncharacterized protein LOC129610755 isoform X2 [Condylostylus longicornis]|nr:uncharacterized protein LOC129610755 isoform X2 [Condylostylus longicornis]
MERLKQQDIFKLFVLILLTSNSTFALECLDGCKCYWIAELFEADCSYRELEQYPNNSQQNDIRIDAINFSNNKFTEFPYYLSKAEDFTFIDLTNNSIKRLKPNTLNGFKSLRTLFLSGNNFSTWSDINPNTAFKNAKNLETLSLSNNPITSFSNVDETLLIVSHSIVVLDLAYCRISKLAGEYMLSGLTVLERLILNGNPLKLLTSLISDTLKVYDLSDCQIKSVTSDALAYLPNLIHLNLSYNSGISLKNKNGEFLISTSVLTLDLSNCNLDVVETGGFRKLSTLIFNGNLLKKLNPSFFANNSYIEYLDLSRNSINHIDVKTFSNLPLLKKLDLSYNVISNIDANLFAMNDFLILLNLEQNFISRFQKMTANSLIHLNLNSNDISKIDSDALSLLSNISILDLSYNVFSIFPSNMESNTLQVLDLSMARLIRVTNRTFQGFPLLNKLDLSGNRLTKTIKVSYFKNNPYLQEIRLHDNLWECDCNDKEFQELYSYYMQRRTPGTRLKEIPQCGHPINSFENTWGQFCKHVWSVKANMGLPEKIWVIIFSAILVFVGCLCLYTLFKRMYKGCKKSYNQRILRRNLSEQREIRRQNDEMLQQQNFQNAPTVNIRESNPPCYEEALLMPKIDRSKSMDQINVSNKQKRKTLHRTNTNVDLENEENLIIGHSHFLSEERLLDRNKERLESNFGYVRRHQARPSDGSHLNANQINYDSKFPPAHMKSQNLQSAEYIAVIKNSRTSPYSSRKWKMHADSISFASISDDEIGVHRTSIGHSKNGGEVDSLGHRRTSPYSRRRPRGVSVSQLSISRENIYDEKPSEPENVPDLAQPNKHVVLVENHFRDESKKKNGNLSTDTIKSSISSDFDKLQIPSKEQSIQSLPSDTDNNGGIVIVNLPTKESKF